MQTKSKKKQIQRKSKVPTVKLGVGFPPQLECTLKYVDQFTLTAALGVMANYRFRASGMFDPNHTAAGHQPGYFDNLTAIYDNWVVTSSVIDVTFVPTTSPQVPAAFGIARNDDVTTVPTSFVSYMEGNSGVKVQYLTLDSGDVKRLVVSYALKDVFPGDAMSNPGFWGSATSDPSPETIFNVFLQAVDQVSSTACYCIARVTYHSTWFELKDIVLS